MRAGGRIAPMVALYWLDWASARLENALSIYPDSAFGGRGAEGAGVAELLDSLPGDSEKYGSALDADVARWTFPCLAAAQKLLHGLLGNAVTNNLQIAPVDEPVDP